MLEVKSLISPLTTIVKMAADKLRSAKSAYIKNVLVELKRSIKIQQEFLKTIVRAEDTGRPVNISDYIYWDDKKVKEYLEFKLNVDGRFHFPNENASTLAEDLKPFFYIEGHNLNEVDLQSVLVRVITVAQEEFINNSTTDQKLMNFIQLRQPPNVTKNDLDASIKEVLKFLNQSFKEKEEGIKEPRDFSFRYDKCIQLFESDSDIECLQEIQTTLKNMELSQKEKQALYILEICVHYRRFEYEKAFIMIKEINGEVEEEVLFHYTGIKGAVLSEMGVQRKSAAYIRQGIHCFEQQLDLVTEENSDFVHSILYNLGTSHLNVKENRNDIELAIEYLEEAAKLNPSDAQIYKNLGSAIGYKGDYEKEMELYDRALALNPNLFEALCAKAWGLLNYEHQIDESIVLYKKALTHKDRMFHFPTIYYWLAINYLHKESLDVVLQTIDKGLEIEPDNIHLLGLKINTISNSVNENPPKYLPKLYQLIELSGSSLDTEMKIQISNILISANDLSKAQEMVDSLLSQGECNKLTDVLIGFVYFLYDNNKESLKDENVIKYLNQINPNYIQNQDLVEPYYFLMSQYHLVNKQYDESIEALKQMLSYGLMYIPSHNVYALIGDVYAQKEDYENSKKYFQMARKHSPDSLFDIERGLFNACIHLMRKNCAYNAFYRMLDILELLSSSMMLQKEFKMTEELEDVFSAVIEGSIQLATLKAIMESEEPGKVEKLMASYGNQFTKDIVKRMIPRYSKSLSLLENVIKQKIEKATFNKE